MMTDEQLITLFDSIAARTGYATSTIGNAALSDSLLYGRLKNNLEKNRERYLLLQAWGDKATPKRGYSPSQILGAQPDGSDE